MFVPIQGELVVKDEATKPLDHFIDLSVGEFSQRVIHPLPLCQGGNPIEVMDETGESWSSVVVPVVTEAGIGFEYEREGLRKFARASFSEEYSSSYLLLEFSSLRLKRLRLDDGEISATADDFVSVFLYGLRGESVVDEVLEDIDADDDEGIDDVVDFFRRIYPSPESAAYILRGLVEERVLSSGEKEEVYLSDEVMRKGVRFAHWLRDEADAGHFKHYDGNLARAVKEVFPFMVDGRLPPPTTSVDRKPVWRSLIPGPLAGAIDRVLG